MTDSQFDEFYKQLKKVGSTGEALVNDWVKTVLDNGELAKLLNLSSNEAAKWVDKLKEKTEEFSIPLNIPTKEDITRTLRLLKQVEDKVDWLIEQLEIPKQETSESEMTEPLKKHLKNADKLARLQLLLDIWKIPGKKPDAE
ncbi:hypothetical protein Q75_15485 [Bacillus coahuilensis p1.1.43]|uniref:Uncharacterized protein n=1 Tax=Bacillus coahuilensis p1.1.43 TaxID=1150625 RepID=A0A147K4M1_9BACI|nr:hypothetical protein [Bacillus coahuilensis]KUP04397.1 hypothetical protein Q75_15485 [Bacillus coahuilensis p1.1.43]